jgi:hypothetical protein
MDLAAAHIVLLARSTSPFCHCAFTPLKLMFCTFASIFLKDCRAKGAIICVIFANIDVVVFGEGYIFSF